MKRYLGLLSVLFAVVLLGASIASAQDAVEGGDYYISGTRLDGQEYSGGLEVLRYGQQEYFTLSWQVAEPFYGVGLIDGSVLSAAWGTNCTLATYIAADDGSLSGRWVDPIAGMVNPESGTIIEQSEDMIAWGISGQLSDGSTYEGAMTARPTENREVPIAIVEQQIGDSRLVGVGINTGSVISVAFGPEGCGVAAYTVGEDGTLQGRWTVMGATAVGTENAAPINIAGAHNVTGTSLDGQEYSGTLEVMPDNQVHTFNYTIGEGSFPAVGILRGSTVAVGFGGETCTVASYFVYPNGALSGLWTLVGASTVGTEAAVRNDEVTYADGALIPNIAGTYDITGTNISDGSVYQGAMNIIERGDVYQVQWALANGNVEGVGILFGNSLAVAYGGDTCAVNVYRVTPESMDGVWAAYGQNVLGTESATR